MKKKDLETGRKVRYLSLLSAKYKTKYFLLMTPLLLHTALFFQHCPAAYPASAFAVVHVFVSAVEGFTPLLQAE